MIPTAHLLHSGGPRCAAVLLLLPSLVAAQEQAPSTAYQMFVGMDVEVPFDGRLHPMRRLVNRNRDAEIIVNDTAHQISISESEILRLKRGLKISRARATIGDLQTRPAYSWGNDPWRQGVRAQMAIESRAGELMDQAQFRYTQAVTAAGVINEQTARPETVAGRDAMMAAAEADLVRTAQQQPLFDLGDLSHRTVAEMEAEQYDAIEATFEVSAPEQVADVDLVLVANYTVPGRKEEYHRLVYTRALGTIGPDPRTERVWVQGLPRGFALQTTAVHLYSWGDEIATNLSEKAVPLTDEQALGLLLTEHLTRHRGQTVPARPLWLTAPPNFRALLDVTALPARARLRIDETGRVLEVLAEDGGALGVTGLARRVLTETRFLPALHEGAAVASTLEVELARFLQ